VAEKDPVAELTDTRKSVEQLAEAVAMMATKEDLEKERKARRRMSALAAIAVVAAFLSGLAAFEGRVAAREGREAAQAAKQSSADLKECIVPAEPREGETPEEFAERVSGRCLESQQRRTSRVILYLRCNGAKDHNDIVQSILPNATLPAPPPECAALQKTPHDGYVLPGQ
jgi:hypothetical protein